MRSSPSFPPGKIDNADSGESRAKTSEPPTAGRSLSSRPAPAPSIPSIPRIAPWERVGESDRPPMSLSSLPTDSSAPPPNSQPRPPVAPPVLASDILRDDVAPLAPAQRLIIMWLLLFSLAFGVAAVFSFLGIFPPSLLQASAATAIIAAFAALLPVPYAVRALLAVTASLVPLVLGAQGEGPLAAMHGRGALFDQATIVALTILPGALLFRSRYRAFKVARVILALALIASIPAEIGFGLTTWDATAPLVTRVADAVVLLAVLGAGFGFMGAETTAFGAFWGALIVTTHATGIGLRASGWVIGKEDFFEPHAWSFIAGGVGEWVAATLAAHAIFQLFAALLGKWARRVDVHQIVGISAETKSEPDRLGEDDRPESLGDD
ncbi:MAG: hypothetical protein ACRELY_13325 [Polyangiaceae bacterium]